MKEQGLGPAGIVILILSFLWIGGMVFLPDLRAILASFMVALLSMALITVLIAILFLVMWKMDRVLGKKFYGWVSGPQRFFLSHPFWAFGFYLANVFFFYWPIIQSWVAVAPPYVYVEPVGTHDLYALIRMFQPITILYGLQILMVVFLALWVFLLTKKEIIKEASAFERAYPKDMGFGGGPWLFSIKERYRGAFVLLTFWNIFLAFLDMVFLIYQALGH